MKDKNRFRTTSQVLWGTVLLVIGTVLLLDNLDVISIGSVWEHWPLLIVAIGVGKLVAARHSKEFGDAVWWLFIGGWLYISVFEIYGLGFHNSWPLLLIGWGITMVWKSLVGDKRFRISGSENSPDELRPSKGESS